MAHLRIQGKALSGREICSHPTNPVGSSGRHKPQSAFHDCIDGTFSSQILGQVPPCLFDCSLVYCWMRSSLHVMTIAVWAHVESS